MLTPKQALFVKEYLVDLNATQAAIRAGYSEKTAGATGNENLQKPEIADAVRQAMEERGERTEITADRVLVEIERLALYDPKDFLDVTGPKDIALLPEDVRRAITGWKWDRQGNFIITFAKEAALQMLGRHHKLFTDKVDVSNPDGSLKPQPTVAITKDVAADIAKTLNESI